jgi:hypothetical protein
LKTFAEETGAGDYYDPKLFHEWLNRKGFASGGHVKTNSPEVSAAGYNSASWNILGEAA